LKPENLLLKDDTDGPCPVLKIADFGLSQLIGPNERLLKVCGTWAYAAPEMSSPDRCGYDCRFDCFSYGVVSASETIVSVEVRGSCAWPVSIVFGLDATLTPPWQFSMLIVRPRSMQILFVVLSGYHPFDPSECPGPRGCFRSA
jgi:serine/threonine protein kinase